MTESTGPHPDCWRDGERDHSACEHLTGQPCTECGDPAGTIWTPLLCPPCDVARLEQLGAKQLSTER